MHPFIRTFLSYFKNINISLFCDSEDRCSIGSLAVEYFIISLLTCFNTKPQATYLFCSFALWLLKIFDEFGFGMLHCAFSSGRLHNRRRTLSHYFESCSNYGIGYIWCRVSCWVLWKYGWWIDKVHYCIKFYVQFFDLCTRFHFVVCQYQPETTASRSKFFIDLCQCLSKRFLVRLVLTH